MMYMIYFAFFLGAFIGAVIGAILMQHKDQEEIDRLEIENAGLRADKFRRKNERTESI